MIALAFISDEAAPETAGAVVDLAHRAGLAGTHAVERPSGAMVVFGGFASPGDQAAQRALARVRQVTVEGRRVFPRAFLAPSPTTPPGSAPQIALMNAKATYGPDAKYTLQVAVYQSDDAREARRLAEEAAIILRRDGDLAFYHHGPTRSMVTVGLFSDRDFDPQSSRLSEDLRAIMARYPDNLFNGRAVRERGADGQWRQQSSSLVLVP